MNIEKADYWQVNCFCTKSQVDPIQGNKIFRLTSNSYISLQIMCFDDNNVPDKTASGVTPRVWKGLQVS